MKLHLYFAWGVLLSAPLFAQLSPSPLYSPITMGLVGTIQGGAHFKPSEQADDSIGLKELELTLTGKVHPGVDATAIIGLHQEDGEFHTEIENGFLEFAGLSDGLSISIGRKFIPFGKQNTLHPEQWPMILSPAVYTSFIGEHALTGDGLATEYLLPVPFFSRLEIGYWKNTAEHEEDDEAASFAPTHYITSARLWNSISLTKESEFELGFSGLQGSGPEYESIQDEALLLGSDVTFKHWLGPKQRIMVQSELMQLQRKLDGDTLTRTGGFVMASYRTETDCELGFRWDKSQSASDEGDTETLSLNVMQKFSETYFGRITYQHDLINDNPALYGQLVFNLGSHTHALQ